MCLINAIKSDSSEANFRIHLVKTLIIFLQNTIFNIKTLNEIVNLTSFNFFNLVIF